MEGADEVLLVGSGGQDSAWIGLPVQLQVYLPHVPLSSRRPRNFGHCVRFDISLEARPSAIRLRRNAGARVTDVEVIGRPAWTSRMRDRDN